MAILLSGPGSTRDKRGGLTLCYILDVLIASEILRRLRGVAIGSGMGGGWGGLGRSGNLRPAGAAMIDSCAYPIASMVESGDAVTIPAGMTAPERV